LSSGKHHDQALRISILPSAIIFGIIITIFIDKIAGLYAAIFFYLGEQYSRMCSPDSDIDKSTYQDFYASFFEFYLGFIWKIIWIPYRLIVSHRSWVSHTSLFGTLIRFTYIFGLPYFLALIAFPGIFKIINDNWDLFLYFFIGTAWGDQIHLILDFILPLRYLIESILDKIFK